MPFPATLPAPASRISAAEALACWQRADWPGGVGKGARFGVTGQTWRFWGERRGGRNTHTRLRQKGSVHRACFVMLDSSSPPPARWDTASAAFCLTLLFGRRR